MLYEVITDLTLMEVNEASMLIQQNAHDDAHIIFGAVIDDQMDGHMRVTVIATGFEKRAPVLKEVPPLKEVPILKRVENGDTSYNFV